jgi:mRNA-degrading endonuclease RelE of RelBE toxin-antitoxin system
MKFSLVYTKRAIRDVRKLEAPTKRRIGKALLRFEADPLKYAEKITDPNSARIVFVLAITELYLTWSKMIS